MSEENRAGILDEIKSLCREFRKGLKAGHSVSMEEVLGRIDNAARESLFQNLLHIDVEFRRQRGESPNSDQYIRRFPQYASLIRQAFFESTMTSQEYAQDTPDNADVTVTLGVPATQRLGDYELLRELGRGGFGVVYEARHLQRGDRVALKTLPMVLEGPTHSSRDAERLHRFRQEFRTLSEINHPNLAGMQTLEVDGTHWFFTMDLVEGVDFLDYVRPGGTVDETRLRNSLKQLIRGIMALHEQRILHRDLKPSNVLVDKDGRVSILDFGLAAELQQAADQTASMQSRNFAGTPRYAAPEQAFGERSPATDWYALGTMLYEALVGEAPFRGTASELLIKKQNENAPALGERDELPHDLTTLVDQLLRKEPRQRPDAVAICGALEIDSDCVSHEPSDGSVISMDSRSTERLVGRETQLTQLQEAYQKLSASREPLVVFIRGRSGEGKTSLAEAFLSSLRRDSGALVLSGRCYDRESVPYKAIDPLVDAMVSFLRLQSNDSPDDWLPGDIHLLAHLFPILKRVDAIAARATGGLSHLDERQIRYRGFYALKDLLGNIGQTMPIVLFIDDLQWGDADSAEVLFDLLSPPDPPQVMLLGSYRSDEAKESSFLQEWNRLNTTRSVTIEATEVTVAPLDADQCLTLLANRVGLETEMLQQQAAELFQDTHGNPYFLEQLIEGFDPETGQFTPIALHEIIDRKLTRLPVESAELLNVIAIAGQAVSIEEASWVAGHATPLYSTITHMRSERLVRLIGSTDQQLVDTYHDKIRETALGQMSDSERQQRHLKLAEIIEAKEGLVAAELLDTLSSSSPAGEYDAEISARVFDLADHFAQAGDERAFVYQLMAAEQSLRAYAIEDALELYKQAERLLPEHAPATLRYRLWLAMGRVFLWNQQVDAAFERYQKAVESAANAFERTRAHAGLGHVMRQVARFDQAIGHYDDALKHLQTKRPSSKVGKAVSFLGKSCRILVIPATWQQARNDQDARSALLLHEIASALGRIVMLDKSFLDCTNELARSALAMLQAGGTRHLSIGHAAASNLYSGIGLQWVGNLCLRRSRKCESQLEDPGLKGFLILCQGMGLFYGGNPRQAEGILEQALPHLRRCGAFYDTLAALHMLRHTRAYVSCASRELSAARAEFELSTEIGNAQCICWGAYNVASAAARQGDLAEAQVYIEKSHAALSGERYFLTEAVRSSTNGYVKLQCSEYEKARELALTAWNLTISKFLLIDHTLLCLPVLIESIAGPNWTSPLATDDRKVLKRMLRRAVLLYPTAPNHQPHLRRVYGRAYWTLGKQRKAIRNFEKAIGLSKQKGMDYQRAKSLLDLAAVKEEGREENRREAITMLKKMESVIPRAEGWLLGDQYDEAVVAPEFDASEVNPNE